MKIYENVKLKGESGEIQSSILIANNEELKKYNILPCVKEDITQKIGKILSFKEEGYTFILEEEIESISNDNFNQKIQNLVNKYKQDKYKQDKLNSLNKNEPNSLNRVKNAGVILSPISSLLRVNKEGRIQIVVAMDLGPFFEDKFQEEFLSIRNLQEWNDFLGFENDKKNTLKNIVRTKKGLVDDYDKGERIIEKIGYDMDVFRGSLYHDFFMPIYEIKKDKFKKILQEEENKLSASMDTKGIFLKYLLRKLQNFDIKIKIKITRSGVVYTFFEKDIKEGVDILKYIREVKKLLMDPYYEKIEELKREIKDIELEIKQKEEIKTTLKEAEEKLKELEDREDEKRKGGRLTTRVTDISWKRTNV